MYKKNIRFSYFYFVLFSLSLLHLYFAAVRVIKCCVRSQWFDRWQSYRKTSECPDVLYEISILRAATSWLESISISVYPLIKIGQRTLSGVF